MLSSDGLLKELPLHERSEQLITALYGHWVNRHNLQMKPNLPFQTKEQYKEPSGRESFEQVFTLPPRVSTSRILGKDFPRVGGSCDCLVFTYAPCGPRPIQAVMAFECLGFTSVVVTPPYRYFPIPLLISPSLYSLTRVCLPSIVL